VQQNTISMKKYPKSNYQRL